MIANSFVIFDTNVYRSLTHNSTHSSAKDVAIRLRKNDSSRGNTACASPIVIWELLSHLNSAHDADYERCLSAIIALVFHTCDDFDDCIIRYVPHPAHTVCRELFQRENSDAQTQAAFTVDAAHRVVVEEPSFSDSTVEMLHKLHQSSTHFKSTWIDNISALLDDEKKINGTAWFGTDPRGSRRALRSFFGSTFCEQMIAQVIVKHHANDMGISLSQSQCILCADKVIYLFPVVIKHVSNFLLKLHSSGPINLRNPNKAHANFCFDTALCYLIGNGSINDSMVVFVTDDRAILKAAYKAGVTSNITTPKEYFGRA